MQTYIIKDSAETFGLEVKVFQIPEDSSETIYNILEKHPLRFPFTSREIVCLPDDAKGLVFSTSYVE